MNSLVKYSDFLRPKYTVFSPGYENILAMDWHYINFTSMA